MFRQIILKGKELEELNEEESLELNTSKARLKMLFEQKWSYVGKD